MDIQKFFTGLLFGKRDLLISQLREELVQLKITKQRQIDETNKYYKKQIHDLKNKFQKQR